MGIGMTVIERDAMNAIIRAAKSLNDIAQSLHAISVQTQSSENDEEIYRRVQHRYHVIDATERVGAYLEENYTDAEIESLNISFDFDYLADAFAENHDCNVSDNAQWYLLIEEYLRANGYTK